MAKTWKKKKQDAAETAPAYDRKKLAEIAELETPGERAAELRWLGEQGEITQLEIMARRDLIYRQKRESGEPYSVELSQGALLLAVKIIHREQRALSMKMALDAATAADVSKRKMDKYKSRRKSQRSPKYSEIKNRFFVLIERMLERGFSWADISFYLQKEHGFPCTRGYLCNAYKRIKEELGDQRTTETNNQEEAE